MLSADGLLRDGDLAGARAVLVQAVKSQPGDEPTRMFLFQLLALSGEWEKARTQLQALASLSAEAQMLAVAYGQAIDAEQVREAVFAGKAKAALLAGAGGWAEGLADAIQLIAQGQTEAGIAARDAAFDLVPEGAGRWNDTPFEWLADCDSRFGPCFEAIIGGKYGLVPFDTIETVKSDGPVDLRDIVWYPVQIAFKSGQSVAGFLPARYPESHSSEHTAEKLARMTGWTEAPWGEAGKGQHLLTLSGEEDQGLLALRMLAFD